MEHKIVNQLTKLQEHIKRYEGMLYRYNRETRPNIRQSLRLLIQSTNKRIKQLQEEIHSTVYAPIIEVTYDVSGTIHYARITNVSRLEATDLIRLMAQSKGKTVNILEIREIPTFLCESKL